MGREIRDKRSEIRVEREIRDKRSEIRVEQEIRDKGGVGVRRRKRVRVERIVTLPPY